MYARILDKPLEPFNSLRFGRGFFTLPALSEHRVLYRETHALLDKLAEANLDGSRKEFIESAVAWPLLIIDDLGMRKLPLTAAEDLLEIIMRRYERASTLVSRP